MKRALLITIAFIPIVFMAFAVSIIGDCGNQITAHECQAGKDATLRNNMLVVFAVYVAIIFAGYFRRNKQ